MTGVFVRWNPWTTKGNAYWVEDGTGCEIWVGAKTKQGYAMGGYKGHVGFVYRLRYEMEIGPIPEGMHLDHICNRGGDGCCNPRHCRPVTPRENILRSESVAASNRAKTHCPKGHPLDGNNLVLGVMQRLGSRQCRTCANERQRETKSGPEWLAKRRANYLANREARNRTQRAYEAAKRAADPEGYLEKLRAYHRANAKHKARLRRARYIVRRDELNRRRREMAALERAKGLEREDAA